MHMRTTRDPRAGALSLARGVAAGFAVLVVVAVGALALASTATPAVLKSVSPPDGAQLSVAPQSILLRFSGDFAPREFHVAVVSATGSSVACETVVDGQSLVTAVRIDTAGVYRLAYHVVQADGSELAGASRFTVASGQSAPCVVAAPESEHSHTDPLSVALTVVAVLAIAALCVVLLRPPRLRE